MPDEAFVQERRWAGLRLQFERKMDDRWQGQSACPDGTFTAYIDTADEPTRGRGYCERRALERGDLVEPGLDRPALSKHENGHKRPGPYYRALYSEVYGATSAELGFCVALPGENRARHARTWRRRAAQSARSTCR